MCCSFVFFKVTQVTQVPLRQRARIRLRLPHENGRGTRQASSSRVTLVTFLGTYRVLGRPARGPRFGGECHHSQDEVWYARARRVRRKSRALGVLDLVDVRRGAKFPVHKPYTPQVRDDLQGGARRLCFEFRCCMTSVLPHWSRVSRRRAQASRSVGVALPRFLRPHRQSA
jgi:hypothetical protein